MRIADGGSLQPDLANTVRFIPKFAPYQQGDLFRFEFRIDTSGLPSGANITALSICAQFDPRILELLNPDAPFVGGSRLPDVVQSINTVSDEGFLHYFIFLTSATQDTRVGDFSIASVNFRVIGGETTEIAFCQDVEVAGEKAFTAYLLSDPNDPQFPETENLVLPIGEIQPPSIARLEIVPSETEVLAGEIKNFNITAFDASGAGVNIAETDVEWTVIDGGGGVTRRGRFTGTEAGRSVIRATLSANPDIFAEATVLVVAGSLAELAFVSQPPEQMRAGASFQFQVIGTDVNGNRREVSPTELKWELEGDAIGELREGLLTAQKVGTAIVKATVQTGLEPEPIPIPIILVPVSDLEPVEVRPVEVEVTVTGITVRSNPIIVVPGGAAHIVLEAHPPSLPADGESTATLTIAVGDAFENTIDDAAVFLAVKGEGSVSDATPTGDGRYTATYTAGSTPGTVTVVAGTENNNTDTLTLTLTAPSRIPIAHPQQVETAEDTAVKLALTGNDPDGNPLTFDLVTPAMHGTLSNVTPVSDGTTVSSTDRGETMITAVYTPELNFNGSDGFTFTVSNGTNESAPAEVTIEVIPVNDAPTANAQPVTTQENTAVVITLRGSDVDGDLLTFRIAAPPARGTLSPLAQERRNNEATVTYTPNPKFTGSDGFRFRVNDGTVSSDPKEVSIEVTLSPLIRPRRR